MVTKTETPFQGRFGQDSMTIGRRIAIIQYNISLPKSIGYVGYCSRLISKSSISSFISSLSLIER